MRTSKRACAVIIKDDKILVFHRFKNGREYFAFPGGGVEEGETEEEAVKREIKEELNLDIKIDKLLFMVETKLDTDDLFNLEKNNQKDKHSPYQYFYLVTKFSGIPELSGSEKERNNENDRYIIKWLPINDIATTKDLYPKEGREELVKYLNTK